MRNNFGDPIQKYWKILVGLGLFLFLLYLGQNINTGSNSLSSIELTKVKGKLKPREAFHDKWIVVTSINYPTEAIRVWASLPGWRVVVVGDTKTPQDWEYPNCTYLGVEEQKTLGYRVHSLLKYRSYSRKNIGYLYAVQHGAKIIYESDDDNVPSQGKLIYLPENADVVTFQPEEDQYAVNVYSYFGQPTVWPRGFPLRAINPSKVDKTPVSSPSRKFVPIQQGLADYDPDVDAIYRLTQPLNIYFDQKKTPVSLPRGLMCPWNSQNTVFYESAFWGMLIPITTSFRVCDIWRSYWAERILWEIGGELAFLPPSVEQIRNPHDYLADFEDELDLYLQAENLIKFLTSWSSDHPKLEERILDLSKKMVEHGFWEIDDARLMKAWLEDLQSIGYEFPEPASS